MGGAWRLLVATSFADIVGGHVLPNIDVANVGSTMLHAVAL